MEGVHREKGKKTALQSGNVFFFSFKMIAWFRKSCTRGWKSSKYLLRQSTRKETLTRPCRRWTLERSGLFGLFISSFGNDFFLQVQFENGTRMREISFGCKNDEMCCGLLCCERKEETVCDGDCSIKWAPQSWKICWLFVSAGAKFLVWSLAVWRCFSAFVIAYEYAARTIASSTVSDFPKNRC